MIETTRFPATADDGAAAGGAAALSALHALAREGPLHVGDWGARLLRAGRPVPEVVARGMARRWPRLRVGDDGTVHVPAPFWWHEDWAIVDLETTGMDPRRGAQPIEVAAWRVRGDAVVDRLVSWVDPGHPIPPIVTAVTGIDDAMIFAAPSWAQVAPRLRDFLGDLPWVAHNQHFDARFIDIAAADLGLAPLTGARICSLRLARKVLRGGRHALDVLVQRLGVDAAPCHRAEADVAATHQVMLALLHHVPPGVSDWNALALWLGTRRGRARARRQVVPVDSAQ